MGRQGLGDEAKSLGTGKVVKIFLSVLILKG